MDDKHFARLRAIDETDAARVVATAGLVLPINSHAALAILAQEHTDQSWKSGALTIALARADNQLPLKTATEVLKFLICVVDELASNRSS